MKHLGKNGFKINKLLCKNKKVSIIIRTKNEERWIGYAVQSVLDHLYKPEIIIVDNNSTDKTLEIVKSFSEMIGKSSVLRVDKLNFDRPHLRINSFPESEVDIITSEPAGKRLTISKKVEAGTEISPETEVSDLILSAQ